ncbi:MAG: ATP-binding cassette domain-containing protein, partial [Thiotrichaceae bacterium]|nr:ATP-binding cassette domain-containing protein [Thiotrichaceae bacterium]
MKKNKVKKGKSTSKSRIFKRLISYVIPFWGLFLISVVGFLIYAVTQLLFAVLIRHIIDTLQTESREGIESLPLILIGLISVRGVGSFLGNYFLAQVSCNVVHVLRCEIFNKYLYLPTVYFDENNSGYMMSRITHNVGEVTRATTDSARTIIREGLTAIGLLIYLVYSNWLLSLVFLGITPIILVMVKYISRRLRKLSRRIQDSVGDMTHITSELVGGHRTVRSFGGEKYERQRFFDSSSFNRRQSIKLATTTAIQAPLMQILIAMALGGLMYLALVILREASAGEFIAYLTAAFLLPRPIRLLGDANGEIQRGIAAAETLFEVMDEPDEKDEGDYQVSRSVGRLEFKNVAFKYAGATDAAIRNISITVEPGQTVALVGASGGGKSTLVNLIPRLYEYNKGQILLDGEEIKNYNLVNLREQI